MHRPPQYSYPVGQRNAISVQESLLIPCLRSVYRYNGLKRYPNPQPGCYYVVGNVLPGAHEPPGLANAAFGFVGTGNLLFWAWPLERNISYDTAGVHSANILFLLLSGDIYSSHLLMIAGAWMQLQNNLGVFPTICRKTLENHRMSFLEESDAYLLININACMILCSFPLVHTHTILTYMRHAARNRATLESCIGNYIEHLVHTVVGLEYVYPFLKFCAVL